MKRMVQCALYYPLGTSKRNGLQDRNKFLRRVRKDNNLTELSQILREIRRNFKSIKKCTQPNQINILNLLDRIIPDRYFGTAGNRKRFNAVVKKILTRSTHECVFLRSLSQNYNHEKILWLHHYHYQVRACSSIIRHTNQFILDSTVKPLILHFYYPLRTRKAHEIKLIPRPQWKRFESNVLNKLLLDDFLVFNDECIKLQDRITRHKHIPPRIRGMLEIIPKGNMDEHAQFRPLVRFYHHKTPYHISCQKYSKGIYEAARKMTFIKTGNLFKCWDDFTGNVKDEYLYGAKVDIADAFGNIDTGILCDIISGLDEIEDDAKVFLLRHIQNQFVLYKRNRNGRHLVWHWKHGLLQGDPLSSSLCELYMSYLDCKHLQNFKSNDFFFHRTVDDYFFCSTDDLDVISCIEKIKSIHVINKQKTQTNILIYTDKRIEYHGQVFDLPTKQVKGLYKYKKGGSLRHKFKFWNIAKPTRNFEEFLKRSMSFAFNNFHFKKIELNLCFNSEETVMQNFFEAMVFTAFKFDAAVMSRFDRGCDMSVVTKTLKRVVYKYSTISVRKVKSCSGQFDEDSLNVAVFLRLGYSAFALVLKRRNDVYREVLKDIVCKVNFVYVKKSDGMNFKYFTKLPDSFKHIRLSRSVACAIEDDRSHTKGRSKQF